MSQQISYVSVLVDGGHVAVRAPYYPPWVEGAKQLGATTRKENGLRWLFDSRDEERVRALCLAHYGEDGTPTPRCSIRLRLDLLPLENPFFFAGRQIAQRLTRDSPVRLGRAVVLVKGAFRAQGGTMKNPALEPLDRVELEVRDVPVRLAHHLHQFAGVELVHEHESVGQVKLLPSLVHLQDTLLREQSAQRLVYAQNLEAIAAKLRRSVEEVSDAG